MYLHSLYEAIVAMFEMSMVQERAMELQKKFFEEVIKSHVFRVTNTESESFPVSYGLQQQKAEQLAAKLQKYDFCIRRTVQHMALAPNTNLPFRVWQAKAKNLAA